MTTLRFTFTEQEYVSAMRLLMSRKVKLTRTLGSAILALVVSVILLLVGFNPIFPGVIIAFSLVLLFFVVGSITIVPRLNFRKEPSFWESHTVTLTPKGLFYGEIDLEDGAESDDEGESAGDASSDDEGSGDQSADDDWVDLPEEIRWPKRGKLLENDQVFLVVTMLDEVFVMLPKRAFANEEERDWLRRRLGGHP